jgi:hypothetical protein
MDQNIRLKPPPDNEDVILWPDESWCFAHELGGYGWKSDDYERISFDTPRWREIVNETDDLVTFKTQGGSENG